MTKERHQSLSEEQIARLRKFALDELGHGIFGVHHDALTALANDPDPAAWRPWSETKTAEGQWFWWRDDTDPMDLHVDRADPGADGFIYMKYGCGLDFCSECQPVIMADDVAKAVEDAIRSDEERRK